MPFSRKSQRVYRSLVKQAWERHCRDEDIVAKGKAAKEAQQAWYRGVLLATFGVDSSLKIKVKQFAHLCAAFEILARNGIYWQLQADSGAIRRSRYALNALMAEHEMDEPYVEGVARQMFEMRLDSLNPNQLGDLIAALKIHLGRHAMQTVDEPF